jgi:anti-anti-sigma factor
MKILTSTADDGVALVEIVGEVDAHTARELERTLGELLAEGTSRLVLDGSQMGFISSAGLRAIMFAYREVCQVGGLVRICGLSAQVRRIFEIAALDECLQLYDSCREAMENW